MAPEVVAARLRPHRSRPAVESGTRRLAEMRPRSGLSNVVSSTWHWRGSDCLILSGSPRGTMVERDMLSLSSTSGWSFGRAIIDALASSGTGLWSSDSVTSLPEPWGRSRCGRDASSRIEHDVRQDGCIESGESPDGLSKRGLRAHSPSLTPPCHLLLPPRSTGIGVLD